MSDLTDYERERQERIAKNQALLASLQIDAGARATRDGSPAADSKKRKSDGNGNGSTAAKKRAPAASSRTRTVLPMRETRSRAQRSSVLEKQDPAAAKRKREEEEREAAEELAEKKRAKHGDRTIEIWNPTGREILEEALLPAKRSLEAIVTSGSWKRARVGEPQGKGDEDEQGRKPPKKEEDGGGVPLTPSRSTRSSPAVKVNGSSSRPTSTRRQSKLRSVKKEESDSDDDDDDDRDDLRRSRRNDSDGEEESKPSGTAHKASISLSSVTKTLASMELRSVKRITPDRIYSIAVHPIVDKDLVFMGDRKGWLGTWDASGDFADQGDDAENDEDAGDYDKYSFVQRVYNDHGTIACLKFDPNKAHTLYASSYDCTIRSLNFETGVWREEADVDLLAAKEEGEGESLVSAFEITHDGRQMWVSDNRGGVLHQDLRAPKDTARRWKVAESKAGCISLNPLDENYFVTSHLNRDIRLWDARKLQPVSSKARSDYGANFDNACLASFEHGKACSSAYWDSSGTRLLSTSYDNFVRVWDVKDFSDKSLAKLNKDADHRVVHDNQTGAYVSVFKATWCANPDVEPFFHVGNMKHALDVYSAKGKLVRQFKQGIATTPAVTGMHPTKPTLVAGAAGGKVYYWAAEKWV